MEPGANSKAVGPASRSQGGATQLGGFERLVQNVPEGEMRDYLKRGTAEHDENFRKFFDGRIGGRMRRYDEEATEGRIMVDNFGVFRRDYINMAIRRSC